MHHYDLLSSYRGQRDLHFESDHTIWKKVSKFFFVVSFHFLLLLFLLTQSSAPINQFVDRAFNLQVLKPTFFSNNASEVVTPFQVENDSSGSHTSRSPIVSDRVAVKPADASTMNHSQIVERNSVSIASESAIHIPAPESKMELPVIAAMSDAPGANSTSAPKVDLSSDQESERVVRIGESDTRIIEIHQMGASKAIYSMPDLAQKDEIRVGYQVEVGEYSDIESAIVNDIISKIRSRHKKEIFWNSRVKARFVKLSMLPQDHANLEKFLRLEIFGAAKGKDYSFWDKSKF